MLKAIFGFFSRTPQGPPDPVTGLTPYEVSLLQTSMKQLMKKPTDNGVAVLMSYFKKFPEALNYFPFKDVPLDDLPKNKKFKAHANSVIYSLSSVIDNLNEPELVVALLTKIGTNHKKLKVAHEAFWNIKESTLDLLSTIVDKPTLDAWDKGFTTVVKVIISVSD